jgi:hypothetical protein
MTRTAEARMKQTIFIKTQTSRKLPDGIEDLYFETVIDLLQLEQMARDAADNKRGEAVKGPLSVRILERYMRKGIV